MSLLCSPPASAFRLPAADVSSRFRRARAGRAAAVAGGVSGNRLGEVNGAVLRKGAEEAREFVGDEKVGSGVELPVLHDDGFGSATMQDFFEGVKGLIKPDGGPPRWFCPLECGKPVLEGAPVLLFLPGIDGTGMGLVMHHKPLGKSFEVRCLHIPVNDRTPFEGLVKFVEYTVQNEYAQFKRKPIYLVGDSFGGCLALAIAARNPAIDLVLILVNPATSYGRSQLQPLLPLLEALPNELHITVPYMLSLILGNPLKMAAAGMRDELSTPELLDQLSTNLVSLLPRLSDLMDIIPREALLWKLKLLRSAASYANSRMHAIQAEVFVLTSGKDNMLPSDDEGKRLSTKLKKCSTRCFPDNGHSLLLEDGMHLMTVIKAMKLYRRSSQLDHITDFIPPSFTEFRKAFQVDNRWLHIATSPVMFSTLRNGNIVRGLSGVPDEGPVLLVGYHMLLGLDLAPLCEEFLREKKVIIRGMAHPILFPKKNATYQQEISSVDLMRVFGATPASPLNMYKLFSRKSFVLLFPGGAREALHRKGEEYKLFWPEQPEFVRMASHFGATIVPFGVVGEDDIAEVVFDYNDQMNIPFVREFIKELTESTVKLRSDGGEVSEQHFHLPGVLPKMPGRFYFLFGKPIETKGMKESLRDRSNANMLYHEVKAEVENIIAYLKKKREEDPYRGILQRSVYQASQGSTNDIPTFDP